MANGRPPGDPSGRSPSGRRHNGANEEGLAALGRQMRGGDDAGPVANESGLRALGTRIDEAKSKGGKGRRRSGKPKWSTGKKVLVGVSAFVFLVVASDSRAGNTGQAVQSFGSASQVTGQRSDVVQLWRVTPSTKTIQIVSIPRDTVASMLAPDDTQYGTYNRINVSYNTGANQLVKTITANFGIPINHVVQVDFSGFQNGVNALGGIYMNFPYPAKDALSGLNITTPGCQLLNGSQALAVARSRHFYWYQNGYWHYDGTSDFGRI